MQNGKNHRNNASKTDSIDVPKHRDIVAGAEKKIIGVLTNTIPRPSDEKNLIQYNFPFASSVSGLSADERVIIQEQLGATAVKARIYCIRHGMSIQEEEHRKLPKDVRIHSPLSQTADTALCESAKKQYSEKAELLKQLGVNAENTYILYCEGAEDRKVVRVAKSANILIQGLGLRPENILNNIDGLDTTDKDDAVVYRRISLSKTVSIDFATQLVKKLGDNTISDITIICVIHKSNIDGIREGVFQHREDTENHLPKMDEIGTGEITFLDVDISGKPLNYRKRSEVLSLTPKNYENILEVLRGEDGLHDIFSHFSNQSIQLWELQNYINAYFSRHKYLYKKYINSENMDMRVFCIANLIIQKEYTVIGNYYLTPECENILEKEKRLLLQNTKNERIMNIFRKLFICRSELWIEDDYFIVKEYFSLDDYNYLKKNREIYQKADEIQSRSLDMDIKTRKSGAIIEQQTILKVKVGEQEIDIDVNLDTIIKTADSYILAAMVGFGKSLWITSLVKKIITEYPEKQVIFFEGGDWNKKEVTEIQDELLKKISKGNNAILIIDAFDEIGSDTGKRKELFEMLKKLKIERKDLKIIITGRPSEFHEAKNEGFETLSLIFNRDIFIDLKGGNHKKQILDLVESSSLGDATLDNPLFVFFICELANNHNQYKDLGVLSLDTIIKNSKQGDKPLKSLLYENIIKLILAKHKGIELENETIDEFNYFFNDLFNQLSILALGISSKKDFLEIMKEQKWSKVTQSYFFNRISLLLKKEEGKNYGFAHLSFQEYFIFHYRETCYKKGVIGERKWKNIINRSDNIPIIETLVSIGMMDFKSFEQDIISIINKGNNIPVYELLMSIHKINNTSSSNLLEKIVDLEAFKTSPEAIQILCASIILTKYANSFELLEKVINLKVFKTNTEAIISILISIFGIENPNLNDSGNKLTLTNPRSYKFLEKIVDLEVFKINSEAIQIFCGVIRVSKNPRCYKFLEKIVDLEAFKINSEAINSFCWAIEGMGYPRSYKFLEKIVDLEAFKTHSEAIYRFLEIIKVDNDPNNYNLLEKIVDLEAFKTSPEAIQILCTSIHLTKYANSFELLEKIVDLEAFKKSPEAINSFCWAIEGMGDPRSYKFLEKIVDLEAFKTSSEAINSFCWAMQAIQNPNEIILFEKIVDLEAFKTNSEGNCILCCAIGRNNNIKDTLYLLEQIEGNLLYSPIVLYNLSCVYSIFNMKDRSILRLGECLEHIKTRGSNKLEERINAINKDPDLDNIRKEYKFIKLIRKYSKLIKKSEF